MRQAKREQEFSHNSSQLHRSDIALFGVGNLLYVPVGDETTELYTRTTWECH